MDIIIKCTQTHRWAHTYKAKRERIFTNTNSQKSVQTQAVIFAYYKAFLVIHPVVELWPIFPARVLFRYNNTTKTTSQQELRTTLNMQGRKCNKSGYLENQNKHQWNKLFLFSPEKIPMHLYGWSWWATLMRKCVYVCMYMYKRKKKKASEVQKITKMGNEKGKMKAEN